MDADPSGARARAEARRAKILARQKDRLTSITGAYSSPADKEPAQASAGTPPSPAQPEQQAARSHAPAVASADNPQLPHSQPQQQPQQQQPDQNQQQMAALMQLLEQQLQHAQVLGASMPDVQQQQQHVAGGSRVAAAAAAAGSMAVPAGDGDPAALLAAAAGTPQQPTPPQQASLLLRLGPALALSVKHTQLFRLLAALLLAYTALSGVQMPLAPVVLLVCTDLAVVLAGAALLHARGTGMAAAARGDAAGGTDAGAQVPWRLRSFDAINLVPGLRELLASLAGYRAVTTAVSQDFAAYVVTLGLLIAAGEVPGWHVPRLQLL